MRSAAPNCQCLRSIAELRELLAPLQSVLIYDQKFICEKNTNVYLLDLHLFLNCTGDEKDFLRIIGGDIWLIDLRPSFLFLLLADGSDLGAKLFVVRLKVLVFSPQKHKLGFALLGI